MTIKYPNGKTYEEVVKDEKKEGIIKRKRNGLADRANMGMHLENDVIKSCDYYRNLGIASIYKRPYSFQPTERKYLRILTMCPIYLRLHYFKRIKHSIFHHINHSL